MMPLLGFLLQSEDLKKQSDRIIQEVRVSKDAKLFADEFMDSMKNSDLIQKILLLHEDHLQSIHALKTSVDNLRKKIDKTTGSKRPGNFSCE